MALKVYTSEAKGFKVKVRNFGGLIPTFLEVIGENQVGGKGAFYPPSLLSSPPNLSGVKGLTSKK